MRGIVHAKRTKQKKKRGLIQFEQQWEEDPPRIGQRKATSRN